MDDKDNVLLSAGPDEFCTIDDILDLIWERVPELHAQCDCSTVAEFLWQHAGRIDTRRKVAAELLTLLSLTARKFDVPAICLVRSGDAERVEFTLTRGWTVRECDVVQSTIDQLNRSSNPPDPEPSESDPR